MPTRTMTRTEARPAPTNHTQTAIGYVTDFYPDKGFGFAETQDLPGRTNNTRVFFHIDAARKAHIDEGQMVLEDERDLDVSFAPRPRYAKVLLMEVAEGPRGWKAMRWGVRPGLNWVHDFIRGDVFNQVVGGSFVEEIWGERTVHGRIANVILTVDTLTVVFAKGGDQSYQLAEGARYTQPRNGVFTVMFEDEQREVERVLTLAMPGFSRATEN